MNARKLLLIVLLLGLLPLSGLAEEPADAGELRKIGEEAANSLLSGLKQALMQAMSQGGPAEAVRVCSNDAQQLSQQLSSSYTAAVDVSRTSEKYRNPLNAPSSFDAKILQELEAQLRKAEDGQLPSLLRFDPERNTYVYYKTIVTAPLCLSCHGPKETIPSEVAALLRQKYPNDRALGYSAAEFRGAVRVILSRKTSEDRAQ